MCASAACCAGCLICKCVGNVAGPRSAYLLTLFVSTMLAWVLRVYGHEMVVDLYSFEVGCTGDFSTVCLGMQAVYRVSFALFVSFLVMTAVTVCSPSVHRGLWGTKFVIYMCLLAIAFFIPNSFFEGYSELSRIGSILFVVLQVLILIDFAYDLSEFLMYKAEQLEAPFAEKGEELRVNDWKVLYIVLCLGLFAAGLAGVILLYTQYPSCGLNTFFISFTVLTALVYIPLSASVKVNKGVLAPMVVFAYNVLTCWTAITSNPDAECNDAVGKVTDEGTVTLHAIIAAVTLCWTTFRAGDGAYDLIRSEPKPEGKTLADVEMANKKEAEEREEAQEKEAVGDEAADGDGERKRSEGDAADTKPPEPVVEKGVWMFHLTMMLAGLYMAMMLTNWGTLTGDQVTANPELSEQSMWVKIASQWFAVVIYTWTLIAPVCFPNRDFADTHNSMMSYT